MWKADKYSSLPDVVKAALEEMALLVATLSTITLPPHIKNQLMKVKEKLERVQREFPQLKCGFEETVYEQFKEEMRQTPPNDNQIDIYEPVLEQTTQSQIKWDKPIMRSTFEQQPDKRDTPPPIPRKTTLGPTSPLRIRQECPPGSSRSTDSESSQSSVGGCPVLTYEDPAALAPMLYPSKTKGHAGLNRRDTLFPQDSWRSPQSPVEDSLSRERKGDRDDRSESSVPNPPLSRPSGIYCAKSDQHKDPPAKRSSIRMPPKTSKTKEGNETSGYCRALWDCDADVDNELSFRRGDRMRIVDRQYEDKGWIIVELRGKTGLVPFNYVQVDILTDSTHM